MRCPYCTEEVNSEALVCQNCHRDLSFFRPIENRVSAVEMKLEQLRSARATAWTQSESSQPVINSDSTGPILKSTIGVLCSGALAFLFCWITWNFRTSEIDDKVLNFMSGFAPFFAAVALGRWAPQIRYISFAILGISAGSVGILEVTMLHSIYNAGLVNPNLRNLIFIYVISGGLSFVAGGAIGKRLSGDTRRDSEGLLGQSIRHFVRDEEGAERILRLIENYGPAIATLLNITLLAMGIKIPNSH